MSGACGINSAEACGINSDGVLVAINVSSGSVDIMLPFCTIPSSIEPATFSCSASRDCSPAVPIVDVTSAEATSGSGTSSSSLNQLNGFNPAK